MSLATQPPAPPSRHWVCRTPAGGRVPVVCPPACTADHSRDARGFVEDISHRLGDGVVLSLPVYGGGETPVMRVDLQADPFSDDERRRMPHAGIVFPDDSSLEDLGPEGLAEFIAAGRAFFDEVESRHQRLMQLLAEHEESVS